ncbi:lanthionine synthetase C family protein [Kitasatospora sp. NPDC101183]|uniref:lanthionine synthetase C family protein n=1 Tax=Kitasatospora sp. NPDC101183 TaxID=3364100 RepID=UPI003823B2DD
MTRTADTHAAQSLATGAIGVSLLHAERAELGFARWRTVHEWLIGVTHQPQIASADAGLFIGVPALAFAVHTAAAGSERYTKTLPALDQAVHRLVRLRLDRAHARIDSGEFTRAAEYDLLYGLTGLGAHLLKRDPHGDALHDVLAYLVRLTQPLPGTDLPGWWVRYDPAGRTSATFPGGHGNLGLAHGITGPLALLALAKRSGVTVEGHTDAMLRILDWLDTFRQPSRSGSWWPQWVTADEHRLSTVLQGGPPRPSWCYGTPGQARAQQLAGITLGDTHRKRVAENALLHCLTDPAQLDQITEPGLCHGAAGLLHTVHRTAHDATHPDRFTAHLPALRARLNAQLPSPKAGFLDGTAGVRLALHAADRGGAPATGWDACLLLA